MPIAVAVMNPAVPARAMAMMRKILVIYMLRFSFSFHALVESSESLVAFFLVAFTHSLHKEPST